MTLQAGIYNDISPSRYYADELNEQPTLNGSVVKHLIRATPRHAWTAHPKLNPDYEQETASRFDIGTAAHEVFLLGNDELVHVVDAPDWRRADAREVRDRARRDGLVPLLAHEWVRVSEMLTALRAQLPHLACQPPMFVAGQPEQTLIWEDHGVLCRARVDYLHDSHLVVDDLKTCKSASPLAWAARTMWAIQADVQAAFTIRGIEAVTGGTPDFRFLACEIKPPYAIQPVRLTPAALEFANRNIARALEKWRRCLESGQWPAYPATVFDADPPGWIESQMWDAEQLDEVVAA